MPLVNRELFAQEVVNNPGALRYLAGRYGAPFGATAQAMRDGVIKVNRESALALLDQVGVACVGGFQMGKSMRPWDITPKVFDKLDRAKPWWGFEFETGWCSRDAYKEAVRYVWDNFDGCMFDSEGEGANAVEITFCPSEMHTYLDGTAPAYKFIEWMDANKHLPYNGGGNDVGTHLNMSDPRFNADRQTVRQLVQFLNRTLHFTVAVNGQRKKMFGRESVYAGFFHNESNNGANHWMEFKGFRTTYNLEEFQNYIKTAAALQKVVDLFFDKGWDAVAGKGVSNLYDVAFNDADPIVRPFADVKPAVGAARLSTRGGGSAHSFGEI
jgi:hypothetical protein